MEESTLENSPPTAAKNTNSSYCDSYEYERFLENRQTETRNAESINVHDSVSMPDVKDLHVEKCQAGLKLGEMT